MENGGNALNRQVHQRKCYINESVILLESSNELGWTAKSTEDEKNSKKFWSLFVVTFDKSFLCLKIFIKKWQPWKSWQKNSVLQNALKISIFGVSILFFYDFQEYSFIINFYKHIEHLSKVNAKKLEFFEFCTIFLILLFTRSIWARVQILHVRTSTTLLKKKTTLLFDLYTFLPKKHVWLGNLIYVERVIMHSGRWLGRCEGD